jgi:uroporphyrinogen decarboxylase
MASTFRAQPVPDFDRVVTTLHHEEPDRVPLAEAAIDFSIMSQFLGRTVTDDDLAAQVEFWSRAGYDYILLSAGMMRPGGLTRDSHISRVIRTAVADQDDDDSWDIWKRPRIHDEDDVDAFPWEAAARLDLSKFYAVQAHLPRGMKIIATSGKIFTMAWMAMGFDNFAVNLKLNPSFVGRVIEHVARIQLDGLRQVASIPNVAAVWAVDDIAYRTGPILSLGDLRTYLFPWYEEYGRICHEEGLHFFFHTDGVVWDLLEDLIALGVDALHPIDPTCMDIEEVKDRVGDRLTIIGNISNELLEVGTPDEVAALTRDRIRTCAPGGGYCLGSGNSVPDWASVDNYRAMINAALECGSYPIGVSR